MKGIDASLSFMIALMVGLIVIVIVSTMLSGSSTGLEEFASTGINLSFGGGS